MTSLNKNHLIAAVIVAAALGAGAYAWTQLRTSGPGAGFASGNGRIEATEIDVAAKLGGRITDIAVKEGDFVSAGQVLAQLTPLHQSDWWHASDGAPWLSAALKELKPALPEEFGRYLPS